MYYNVKNGSKKTELSNVRFGIFTVAIVAAIMLFGSLSPTFAKGGNNGGGAALPGDNKQIVTGTTAPCAKTTIDAGATVKATSMISPNTGETVTGFTPLDMRGTLNNCSTSLQSYYITFNEAPRNVFDTIGQPTCTLTFGTGQWSVGAYIMKSGDKNGWSFTNDISSGAGVADPTNCFGTHMVDVQVIDMSTGVVLQTTRTSYTVVQ